MEPFHAERKDRLDRERKGVERKEERKKMEKREKEGNGEGREGKIYRDSRPALLPSLRTIGTPLLGCVIDNCV